MKKTHIKQVKATAPSQLSWPLTLMAFRSRVCFYVFRKLWGFLFPDLTTSVDHYKELASTVSCGKDFQSLTATVWRTKPHIVCLLPSLPLCVGRGNEQQTSDPSTLLTKGSIYPPPGLLVVGLRMLRPERPLVPYWSSQGQHSASFQDDNFMHRK